MKKNWFMRIVCLLLVSALLLSACKNGSDGSDAQPQVDHAQAYIAAVEALSGKDVALQITINQSVTVAGQTYKESSQITQTYWDVGTQTFMGCSQQETTFGDDVYETTVENFYSDGIVYQEVKDEKFFVEMSQDAFMETNVPLQMLEPAGYTVSREGNVLTFADGTAGESWVVPESAQLTSTSGKVVLDENGNLASTEYSAAYQYGAAQYEVTYKAEVAEAGTKPTAPKSKDDYTEIDDLTAVYALEHAYGYLSQAKNLSSQSNLLIVSEAVGIVTQGNNELDAYAQGDTYAMKWEVDVSVKDYSSGREEEQSYVSKMVDGKYTISEDGSREKVDSSMTQEDVQTDIVEHITSNIQENGKIASVTTTHLGSVILYEYTGTEEMSEELKEEICTSLFADPKLLDQYASKYETKQVSFYLGLDAYSYLPTAVGLMYEGVHTIDGTEYLLSRQLDQSFDLASMTSYYAVYDTPAPETEPENKATPLLYKVTGPNGEQMWLFGTIHVGDDRTAFLPQEIYDALSESDALAIECNVKAFEEEIEEDEDLQEQVSEYYFYSDGTKAKDHIQTPELYEDAVKMMKATGNYYYNTEYLSVDLWASSVDNFYMQQSYTLVSHKGVEERLIEKAEDQKLPIYEVESTVAQIQMSANYSDELKEVLLFTAMCGDTASYGEGVVELYELWCAGDEAALKEALKEDKWELKEEDFDLTELSGEDLERANAIIGDLDNINARLAEVEQEYTKAMETDRNQGMTQVAVGYLNSGETVFYAVGLAHLLAEDGLVNGLREAGYTVELVTYS